MIFNVYVHVWYMCVCVCVRRHVVTWPFEDNFWGWPPCLPRESLISSLVFRLGSNTLHQLSHHTGPSVVRNVAKEGW